MDRAEFFNKAGRDEALTLSLDGWEGPIDLLLILARSQKVDLREISILALVEQYLAYLESAESLRLEIAADYLVMAAWLAYLKSCLLLPRDPEADPSPEELAWRLQQRLARLDAMRNAGARLILAPDHHPVTWTETERKKGQAWGLKTIESFHTRGTPPLPDMHGNGSLNDLGRKGVAS